MTDNVECAQVPADIKQIIEQINVGEQTNLPSYFALQDLKHIDLLIKSRLCPMTSFQRMQHEKGDKSNLTMEKLKKAYLSQVDMININISD